MGEKVSLAGGARLRELLEKKAESLHDRLLAVPFVEWCYCGHPHSAHRFYDNKIYDVQGYTCPDILGGEFRLDSRVSAAKQRAACIQLIVDELEKALEDAAALLVPPTLHPFKPDVDHATCLVCGDWASGRLHIQHGLWCKAFGRNTNSTNNADDCDCSLVPSSSPAPQERNIVIDVEYQCGCRYSGHLASASCPFCGQPEKKPVSGSTATPAKEK